jgi:hypothetical protein
MASNIDATGWIEEIPSRPDKTLRKADLKVRLYDENRTTNENRVEARL